MRGPYPGELRIRVIHFVEAGGSRREAGEQFQVSASSAIRWVQRFREDGVCEPFPLGEVFAADPRPDPRTTGPYVE
jgi:transposase